MLALCGFSACYYILTAILLRHWLGQPRAACRAGFGPATFFRPIKSGEPHLEGDLRQFLEGVVPGDQVLVGTGCDEDLLACRNLAAQFSALDIVVVPCQPDLHKNPKVNKLAQLEPHARHDDWIVLDSDTRPGREFLQAFRSEWESSGADAACAPYVFADCPTRAARFDAIGTALSLWPGVSLLRAVGRAGFLTGACMGIKAPLLRARGGWRILGTSLADDHDLGRLVSRSGGRVHIAASCVSLRTGKMDLREWVFHQHRTFATYRLCNPWGSLGLPLTQGVAVSLLFVIGRPGSPLRWLLHGLLLFLRMACLSFLPSGGPRSRPADVWFVCLLEPLFWLSSWILPHVRWGEKWIRPEKIPD